MGSDRFIPTRRHRKRLKVSARWEHIAGLKLHPNLLINGLNSLIGLLFAAGAALFTAGCIGALWPDLLGCCAFMIAALFAVYTPQPLPFDAAVYATGFTLLGAVCFLLGALLLVLEAEIDARIGGLQP